MDSEDGKPLVLPPLDRRQGKVLMINVRTRMGLWGRFPIISLAVCVVNRDFQAMDTLGASASFSAHRQQSGAARDCYRGPLESYQMLVLEFTQRTRDRFAGRAYTLGDLLVR
jgi:hypothetical protein